MENEQYKIIVNELAFQDLDEVIEWYESQSQGLGIDFLAKFNDARAFLKSHPSIYQKIEREFRRLRMKRFPYAVYFKIYEEKNEVLVVAVWHQKRERKQLSKRFPIE